MKHNLNDSIRVKLTDYGKSIYTARLETINHYYGRRVIKDTKPTVDADGFSTFQLWDFMNTFGEYLYMGNTEIVIENLEFEFVRSPWHAGNPPKKGWYLVALPLVPGMYRYTVDYFNKVGKWRLFTNKVVAWQEFDPYKEESR